MEGRVVMEKSGRRNRGVGGVGGGGSGDGVVAEAVKADYRVNEGCSSSTASMVLARSRRRT